MKLLSISTCKRFQISITKPLRRRKLYSVYAELVKLYKHGPKNSEEGICPNLTKKSAKGIKKYFSSWESFSGNIDLPVHSNLSISPLEEYLSTDNKWKGKYGTLRRKLLIHLMTEVRKEIRSLGGDI